MKHILLILITAVILFSCKSMDPIVTREIVTKIDTVYIKEKVVQAPPADVTWEQENPCDSITGLLMDFERIVDNGSSKVVVRSEGGILRTEVALSGSTNTLVEEHRSSMENSHITIEVPVEVNKPWKSKWFWISLGVNLLFILSLVKKFTKWIPFFPL